MSFNEPYFAPMSNYSNTNTGMSVDAVEAWLDQFPQKRAENKPNGGIILSVVNTKAMTLRELSGKERKVAIAKAQREHREALKNLAKQDEQDAKKITKQLVKWRKQGKPQPTAEEIAADKEAKRLRRNELNRIRRNAESKGKPSKQLTEMTSKKGQEVLEKLKAEGVICVADWNMKRKYLSLLITHARSLGFEIESIRSGRFVTHYTLDEQ